MKCPFVQRECVERDCLGWSNGMCFVEAISNKLEILCSLVSKINPDIASENEVRKDGFEPIVTRAEPEGKTVVDMVPKSDPIHIEQSLWKPVIIPEGVKEATLAIDFGTALSKVAVRPRHKGIAIPIPIGETANKMLHDSGIDFDSDANDNSFVEDSLIYIDDGGKVSCGTLGRTNYRKALDAEIQRPAIQNLKQILIAGGVDFSLGTSYFPSSEMLNKQDILSIYLAYLFSLSRTYLGGFQKLDIDLSSTLRNFSFPVWEDRAYKKAVTDMLKGAIGKAYCLEMWFKGELVKGIPLTQLKEALEEANQYGEKLQSLYGAEVTEPVAAGYSAVYNLEIDSGLPAQIFVIDVGAGSSDFALLTISQPRDQKGLRIYTHKQAGVGKGVLMWDNGLRALLRNQVLETTGVSQEDHNFRMFNAKLNQSLRSLKERVIASENGYPIDVNPVLTTTPIRITREQLEASKPVQDALSAISNALKDYIRDILNTLPKDKFDPAITKIVVTGGGSFIPSIVDCVRECAKLLGPSYPRKVDARHVPPTYAEVPGIEGIYPLIAVALGSTEREYPKEQMIEPIAPDPGPHRIGGYFTKGV